MQQQTHAPLNEAQIIQAVHTQRDEVIALLCELVAMPSLLGAEKPAQDLMRWGHAMAVPGPRVQRHPALMALRQQRGRLRFAHADLAGCSLFEEAFIAGCEAALAGGPMMAR